MPTTIPNIILCYLAHPGEIDPTATEIAHRYWATLPNGKFLFAAADLRRHYGFRTASTMIDVVSAIASARHRCLNCGELTPLQMRSEIQAGHVCASCSKTNRQALLAKWHNAITKHMELVDQMTTNYFELPYVICLQLRALQRFYWNQVVVGAPFCAGDAPPDMLYDTVELLYHLYNSKVIAHVVVPNTDSQGFWMDGDGLGFDDQIGYYRMIPHSNGSREDALAIALQRAPADPEAIIGLWYHQATLECLIYLGMELKQYSLPELDKESLSQMRATLREALQQHSIGQLWNAISKITNDAALSASVPGASAVRIVQTMPNRLGDLLKQSQRGHRALENFARPFDCLLTPLFCVFRDQFNLNEMTKGLAAERVITLATTKVDPLSLLKDYRQTLRDLMHEAAHKGLTAEVMLHFGQCQRDRISMAETIKSICATFPVITFASAKEANSEGD